MMLVYFVEGGNQYRRIEETLSSIRSAIFAIALRASIA